MPSNLPPGVSDADIDRHFGGSDEPCPHNEDPAYCGQCTEDFEQEAADALYAMMKDGLDYD